jgi:ATP-dependent DNA ligase
MEQRERLDLDEPRSADGKQEEQQQSSKARKQAAQRSAPSFVEPMAAQVVKALPEGDEWLYEVKFGP